MVAFWLSCCCKGPCAARTWVPAAQDPDRMRPLALCAKYQEEPVGCESTLGQFGQYFSTQISPTLVALCMLMLCTCPGFSPWCPDCFLGMVVVVVGIIWTTPLCTQAILKVWQHRKRSSSKEPPSRGQNYYHKGMGQGYSLGMHVAWARMSLIMWGWLNTKISNEPAQCLFDAVSALEVLLLGWFGYNCVLFLLRIKYWKHATKLKNTTHWYISFRPCLKWDCAVVSQSASCPGKIDCPTSISLKSWSHPSPHLGLKDCFDSYKHWVGWFIGCWTQILLAMSSQQQAPFAQSVYRK